MMNPLLILRNFRALALCISSLGAAYSHAQMEDQLVSVVQACRYELNRKGIDVPIEDSLLLSEGYAAFVSASLTQAINSLELRSVLWISVDECRIHMTHSGPDYDPAWEGEERHMAYEAMLERDTLLLECLIDSLFQSPLQIEIRHRVDWELEPMLLEPAPNVFDLVFNRRLLFGLIKEPVYLAVAHVRPLSREIERSASVPTWNCILSTLEQKNISVLSESQGAPHFSLRSTIIESKDERWYYQSQYVVELKDAFPNDAIHRGRIAEVKVVREWRKGTTGGWLDVIYDEGGDEVVRLLQELRSSVENCKPITR